MDKKQILSDLERIESLRIWRNPFSRNYVLYVEVPEYSQIYKKELTQMVGKLSFRKRRYTTSYPPNYDQFLPDEPIAQRLASVQRQVIQILEQRGFSYIGIDERIQQLGVEIGVHSRDVRTLDEVARDLLEGLR